MRSIDEILDAPFDTVTPEEWARVNQAGEQEESDRSAELEARLTQSVSDWAKFNQVISDILNS